MTPEVAIASPRSSIKCQVRAKAKTTLLIACKFKYQVSVLPGKTQTQRSLCGSAFFFFPSKATGIRCLSLPAKRTVAIHSPKVWGPWTAPQLLTSTSLCFIIAHSQPLIFYHFFPQSSFIFSSIPEPPCQRLTYWSAHPAPSSHTQAPSRIKLRTFIGRQAQDYYT